MLSSSTSRCVRCRSNLFYDALSKPQREDITENSSTHATCAVEAKELRSSTTGKTAITKVFLLALYFRRRGSLERARGCMGILRTRLLVAFAFTLDRCSFLIER